MSRTSPAAVAAAVLLALAVSGCGDDPAPAPGSAAAPTTTAASAPTGPDWEHTDPQGWKACQLAADMVAADVNGAPLDDVRAIRDAAKQSTNPEFEIDANLLAFSLETAEHAVGESDEFRMRLSLGSQVIHFSTACLQAGYPG